MNATLISFLRARKRTLGLDNKVGKKEAIAPDAAITTSTKRVNDSAPEINAEVSIALILEYVISIN